MTVRLLDTNIVSNGMKNHPLAAKYRPHLAGYTSAVSFQTVGELLAGAARGNWGPARRAFLATTLLRRMVVYHSDPMVCEK